MNKQEPKTPSRGGWTVSCRIEPGPLLSADIIPTEHKGPAPRPAQRSTLASPVEAPTLNPTPGTRSPV
jgi:hypothetical protein